MPLTPSPRSRLSLAILLVLTCAAVGLAQSASSSRHSSWEFNLHAAALKPGLFDESSGGLQVGGRLFRNFASGISIGANVDWAAPQDVTLAPFGSSSASLLLYSAELGYQVPVSPRAVFFLGAGFGAARLTLDDAPLGAAASSTGTLVPVGAGFKVLNRAESPSWAIRFDVRDNLILLETASADGGVETEPRNNFEASVGFSFLFGGAGPPEPSVAERDSDRDGVPDPLDFCLNRPGAIVDARGCPLRPEPTPDLDAPQVEAAPEVEEEAAPEVEPEDVPEAAAGAEPDADRDGVPDSADGCFATPEGVAVSADGCPVPVAPAGEPLPGDEDGDGVADERDECRGTPAGLPIDGRGCLARIEPEGAQVDEGPIEFPRPIEERAPAGEAPPAQEPAPGQQPAGAPATACIDGQRWATGRDAVAFDGRSFRPAGFPQPVDPLFLRRVGSFDGVPIYVSDTATAPYSDFWMPRCGDGNVFELFIESGSGR